MAYGDSGPELRWSLVPAVVRTAKVEAECIVCGKPIRKGQRYTGRPDSKVHVKHTKPLTLEDEERLDIEHSHRWVEDAYESRHFDGWVYDCRCGAKKYHLMEDNEIEILEADDQ